MQQAAALSSMAERVHCEGVFSSAASGPVVHNLRDSRRGAPQQHQVCAGCVCNWSCSAVSCIITCQLWPAQAATRVFNRHHAQLTLTPCCPPQFRFSCLCRHLSAGQPVATTAGTSTSHCRAACCEATLPLIRCCVCGPSIAFRPSTYIESPAYRCAVGMMTAVVSQHSSTSGPAISLVAARLEVFCWDMGETGGVGPVHGSCLGVAC